MCLILFALETNSQYPLVIASNRDEYYERPTQQAQFWQESPQLLAGRDLQAGGSWLGVTRQRRLAMVTNFRGSVVASGELSRGALVQRFLVGEMMPEDYLNQISLEADQYAGFNLVVADMNEVWYFSNRSEEPPRRLSPGIYGLSNHLLDTPWPKVHQGKQKLTQWLAGSQKNPDDLFTLLANQQTAPLNQLPSTGIASEREQALSSIWIETPSYGTRSSTLLLQNQDDHVCFKERSFSKSQSNPTVEYFFPLQSE